MNMRFPKLSLTRQIYIGLIAGILFGLFFGDLCIIFQPFVSAFIKIMQITVIPLVVTALISGIGGIKRSDARIIIKSFGLTLLLLWIFGIGSFLAMQFAYPSVGRPTLFAARTATIANKQDLLDLFIPSNPFSSLSEGYLPAVVIFCLLLAFVLLEDERSKSLIDLCGILNSAFFSITDIVSKIIPLGVFFTMAYNAGTLDVDYFLGQQAYYASIIVLCTLLCAIILPLIVSCLTPFGFREILNAVSKSAILAFSSGNVTITLPLIEKDLHHLFRMDDNDERSRALNEALVPLAYIFPTIGSFVPLLFILFAAWYYRIPMHLKDQLVLIAAGVPSVFGSSRACVLFLLDIFSIPEDAFQLYNISITLLIYFVSALGCVSIFSLCAICIAHLTGRLQIRKIRIILVFVVIILLLGSSVIGLRMGFSSIFANSNHDKDFINSMKLPSGVVVIAGMTLPMSSDGLNMDDIISTKIYKNASDLLPENDSSEFSCLERINNRQSLRAGYIPGRIPFSFVNRNGSLVGFDVQMAYELANFLKVPKIEFVPVNKSNMAEFLNNKTCDIVMAGLEPTSERLGRLRFTSNYMTLHLAFLAKENRQDEFEQFEHVRANKNLKIAVIKDSTNFLERMKILLPHAEIVELNDYEDFFTANAADALLTTAEQGSIFAVLHPEYSVATIKPDNFYKIMLAYPVDIDEESFLNIVNHWIDMEEEYGGLDEKYNYWILGEGAQREQDRWSVVKDVLHWVN
jgi:Na+/H+-dicarboxylate symporter/ABC-type amino acid transport substrate-binding protein